MRGLVIVALACTGCLRSTEFKCTDNAQCSATGSVCEMNGYCSFTDSSCASGRRYGEFAGTASNKCVGEEPPIDAGVDMMPGEGGTGNCPSGYNTINGGGTHRYSKIGSSVAWATQRDRCANAGSNVYIAIPDDMAELVGITTLAGAGRTWIGVNDIVTENAFLTVKGPAQTYLPWDLASGEPTDSGPGEDCVTALNTAPLFATDRCGDQFPTVCECEP